MSLTHEQKTLRARGIGGSEIAAVAGLSKFAKPIDVYLRKVGEAPEREDTPHTMRGTHLGPALTRWYEQLTGRVVTHRGDNEKTLVCPTHPIVIATPDGLIHSAGRTSKVVSVLEAKAPHWRTADEWGEPGTDQIPDAYVPQVIWEMAAAEVERAEIAALIDGDLALYSVAWDADLFGELLEIAERFWRDHVEARKPPPPDGSDSYSEHLRRRFSDNRGPILTATAETEMLIARYSEAREQRKAAEESEEMLKQSLQEIIGHNDGIACAAGKITWRTCKGREKRDWEACARSLGANDDSIKAFVTQGSSYRRFMASFK